jgi:hypothetical protein
MVGYIPTVFVGWVVDLVCGVSGLLEFFASFMGASLLSFKSLLSITFFGIPWVCHGYFYLLLFMFLL